MKACQDFEALLSLYANAELEAAQAAAVAAHIEACSDCRQRVVAYRRMAKHLKTMETPALPANLFDDFYEGIQEKLWARTAAPSGILRLLAVVQALHRRHRFVLAAALTAIILASAMVLTQRFRTVPQPPTLARLLEDRNWPRLYHAMRDRESRRMLLDEPVPAKLLKDALTELIVVQSKNQKVREGLERILASMATLQGRTLGLGGSAQVLGKITATGYESARRTRHIQRNPKALLQILLHVGENQTVTIREILLKTI